VAYFDELHMIFIMADVYSSEYQTLLTHLRKARKAAHLTQVEVAKRLNRSQGYVNKVETGERRMDVVQLREFCAAIGADFVDFIRTYDDAIKNAPPME
jgi:transcriptional regulator with XRE-family HTH domain